jgi:hypothetical protein
VRVLVDTHAVLWWFGDPERLSKRGASIIMNTVNTVLVSAATAWELSIKVNLGKMDAMVLLTDLPHRLEQAGFSELPITVSHAIRPFAGRSGTGFRCIDPERGQFSGCLRHQAAVVVRIAIRAPNLAIRC